MFNHSLAQEPISTPPIARADVLSSDCGRKVDRDPYYKPPAPMTINNEDDSPITLGQVVTQAHLYLNEHMEELKTVKGDLYGEIVKQEDGSTKRVVTYGKPYLPVNIAFLFSRVWAVGIGEVMKLGVAIFAEGEFGESTDEFWATQFKLAHVR